mgnify:CR=1 FL=1
MASSKGKPSAFVILLIAVVVVGGIGSYFVFYPQTGPTTRTTFVTLGLRTTSRPPVTYSVFGKIFFDYNGNGRQEAGEPDMPDVVINLDGNNVTKTNSTGWYVIDRVSKDKHQIRPFPSKEFRFMCDSAYDFRRVEDPYSVWTWYEDTRKDIGCMEGFLTLPLKGDFSYNAFFDVDRATGKIKDWQGGTRTVDQHEGTDFGIPIGTPVYSAAPGVVKFIDNWGPEGIFVIISHEKSMGGVVSTLYAHLSSSTVKEGQTIPRGTLIGYSGEDVTKPGPHLHFELDFRAFHGAPGRSSGRYTPVDVFKAVWDPDSFSYWTKDNNPQYST